MAARVNWQGDKWAKAFKAEMRKRTSAAAIRLKSQVQADISQAGTLRYDTGGGRDKRGRFLGKQRTVYNFTHSRPGNPPYKQTGHLRRSMAWELIDTGPTFVGRVGTNLKYGRALELGTRRVRARPYLRPALRRNWPLLSAILLKRFPPGGLPGISSNQSRSGHFGAGARKAGFS